MMIYKEQKNSLRLFLKRYNKVYWFLVKRLLISLFKRTRTNKYLKRIKSLKKNKIANNYPGILSNTNLRIAVYTVLYGNYDTIKPIKYKSLRCDYYIFTDQSVPDNSGWIKRDFSFPQEIKDNPILMNRYLKMHPHLIFSNYAFSIYLDAKIGIECDIFPLLARLGNKRIGLYDHHWHNKDVYYEADLLKRINKSPANKVDKYIDKIRNEGFPINFGFVECCIIIREHNDESIINLDNLWWDVFYNSETYRDQLSFMYCIWKCGMTKNNLACLGADYEDEPRFSSEGHNK